MDTAISKSRQLAKSSHHRYSHEINSEMKIAIAYLALGDNEKAIQTLEAASNLDAWFILRRELDLWFIFDRLRGNPRFDKLLK